jgi:haloalkane dehalogenase
MIDVPDVPQFLGRPVTPQHASVAENKAVWRALSSFDKPFITAFSDNDPVTKGWDLVFQNRIPGARDQSHVTLKGGHFLQEDSPDDIVTIIDGAFITAIGASR